MKYLNLFYILCTVWMCIASFFLQVIRWPTDGPLFKTAVIRKRFSKNPDLETWIFWRPVKLLSRPHPRIQDRHNPGKVPLSGCPQAENPSKQRALASIRSQIKWNNHFQSNRHARVLQESPVPSPTTSACKTWQIGSWMTPSTCHLLPRNSTQFGAQPPSSRTTTT